MIEGNRAEKGDKQAEGRIAEMVLFGLIQADTHGDGDEKEGETSAAQPPASLLTVTDAPFEAGN